MGDIAEAIARGDLEAVGAAFDLHGQELYDYCQSQLGEAADAAEVVEATFVVAAAKASLLPNPTRLRAWLFAIARHACHQQLQAGVEPAYLDDMTSAWDWEQLGDGSPWQADLLSTAWRAIAAMNPAEREVVLLNVRHGLDDEELADILGMTRSRVRSLVRSSCTQFEAAEDLLLAACSGQPWTCETAAGHLNSMEGDLSEVSPRWMKGHAAHCPICAKRGRRNPGPAVLIPLLPSAALPANERERLLWLLSDDSADTAEYRAEVAERVEPFGSNGFPGTAATQASRRRGSYALAACAAVVAVALLGAGAVLVDDHTSSGNGSSPAAAAPASTRSAKSDGSHSSADRKSSNKPAVASPNAANNNGADASSPSPGSASSSPKPKPSTSKSSSPKPSPSKSSSPKPTPSPSTSPSSSPSPSPSPSASASANPAASADPSPGSVDDAVLSFGALFGGL